MLRKVQQIEKRTGYFMILSKLIPHARIAAISLSAERRLKISKELTSKASGIVRDKVPGKPIIMKRPMVEAGTPLIINWAILTNRPMVSTKEKTIHAKKNAVRKDVKTYRSIIFIYFSSVRAFDVNFKPPVFGIAAYKIRLNLGARKTITLYA